MLLELRIRFYDASAWVYNEGDDGRLMADIFNRTSVTKHDLGGQLFYLGVCTLCIYSYL
jgi:hypothetical protein